MTSIKYDLRLQEKNLNKLKTMDRPRKEDYYSKDGKTFHAYEYIFYFEKWAGQIEEEKSILEMTHGITMDKLISLKEENKRLKELLNAS